MMETRSKSGLASQDIRNIPFDNVVDMSPRTLPTQTVGSLAAMGPTNTLQYMVIPTSKQVRMLTGEDLTLERYV